jgi:hypothetical protein
MDALSNIYVDLCVTSVGIFLALECFDVPIAVCVDVVDNPALA